MSRRGTRLTPANYDFRIAGQEALQTGPAYVLEVAPKTPNKYLINGKIWVDATDYTIVRIEGQPARNPSFWVRNVHFVHTYQKVGQFWFAFSTDTTSQVRIFGDSELTIENVDYKLNPLHKSNTTSIELVIDEYKFEGKGSHNGSFVRYWRHSCGSAGEARTRSDPGST